MKTIKLKKRNVAKLSDGQMESLQGGAQTDVCDSGAAVCATKDCYSDFCPTGNLVCIQQTKYVCDSNACGLATEITACCVLDHRKSLTVVGC